MCDELKDHATSVRRDKGIAQAEREKRVKVVGQKLRAFEGRFAEARSAADGAFAPLGEALDGLERGLQKERRAREDFMLGQSAGLKDLEQTLRAELDAMLQGRREGEERAMGDLQQLYERVKGEHSESLSRARGFQEESEGAMGTLLPEARGKLASLRRAREDSEARIQAHARQQIAGLRDAILQEKREREEAEDSVLKALFDFSAGLQAELANERRERGEAEDVLLKLLEETCEKIQLLGTL